MASIFNTTGSGVTPKTPDERFKAGLKPSIPSPFLRKDSTPTPGVFLKQRKETKPGTSTGMIQNSPKQTSPTGSSPGQVWGNTSAPSSNLGSQPLNSGRNPVTPPAPQVGTAQYYANQVTEASKPNALATGATNAAALYGMLGNQRGLLPFSGGTTQGLDQSFANLTRPQSTGNFAGQAGLFDVQKGILQNAAQQTATNALEQQRIQQSGASTNLTASLPQQVSPTNVPFNPLTSQYGQPASSAYGSGGLFGVGQMLQQQQQGGAYQEYQAAHQSAQNLGGQLTQLIQGAGINPSDLNALNNFINHIATNTSDPNYQTFNNLVNDIASSYAQILTPPGGTTTDMVRTISQSLLNAGQSGSSVLQVMQNLDAQAQAKMAGLQTAGNSQTGQNSGGGNYTNFNW